MNELVAKKRMQRVCEFLAIAGSLTAILADFFQSMILIMVLFNVVLCFVVSFMFALWRMEIRTLLLATTTVCILISTFQTHWPLRMRFAASRTWFENAVDEAHAGKVLEPKQWYGLFRPHKIRYEKDAASSSITFDGSWVSGNFCGVVYSTVKPPGRLNTNKAIDLDKNWFFVHGD